MPNAIPLEVKKHGFFLYRGNKNNGSAYYRAVAYQYIEMLALRRDNTALKTLIQRYEWSDYNISHRIIERNDHFDIKDSFEAYNTQYSFSKEICN